MGFVIGTAGHVDHGKSSVIKALTGITTARYREEIEREITIDIGFAHIVIAGVGPVSIIDVPGHEDFIHNMLAGIFGARLALLVIAADDGIMPQTVEHFEILSHCGVSKIIVVLNKSDLVSADDVEYRKLEIEEFLKGTRFENSRIVPFSSATKAGADSLVEAMRAEITALTAADAKNSGSGGLTLYPVDRVFEKPGFGQILTGTLIEGRLAADAIYRIMPEGECRVRSVESHSAKFGEVSGNLRAALNITKTQECELRRGSFIVSDDIAGLHRIITVRAKASTGLARPVKSGAAVKFYFYSACYPAKLRLLDRSEAAAGEEFYAQIIFDGPRFILPFKPFVIRTHTDEETLGGGTVLGRTNELVKNKKAVLESLSIFDKAGRDAHGLREAYIAGELARRGFIETPDACAAMMAPKDQIAEALWSRTDGKRCFLIKDRLLSCESAAAKAKAAIMCALEAHLAENKLCTGLLKQDLTKLCAGRDGGAADILFYSLLIDELVMEGALKNIDGLLSPAGAGKKTEPKLEGDSEVIRRKIMKSFEAEPLTPITLDAAKASVPKNQSELFNKVVKFLENEKRIHKIFENYYITASQLDGYINAIKEILSMKSSFTVIDFKDKTSLSRKFAVAVLEFLDRAGFTVRRENERTLK